MKRAIQILCVVAAFVSGVLVAFLLVFDINQYKDDIIKVVESNTGRDFSIEGDIHLGLSLVPTVVIEKASLGNVPWGTRDSMLDIQRLRISIAVLPLLSREIRIDRFNMVRPDIYLETDAQGRGNWILAPRRLEKEVTTAVTERPPARDFKLPGLHFRRVFIEAATIAFRDGRSGKTHELAVGELTLRSDDRNAPMDVAVHARYRNRPVYVTGTTGSLKNLLANTAFPVDLDAGVGGLRLHADGSVAEPLAVGGPLALELELAADSLEALPGLVGTDLPAVGPVSARASLSGKEGIYKTDPLEVVVGDSDLSGEVDIDITSSKLVLTAQLQSERIDLRPFEPEQRGEDEPLPEHLFSGTLLPVERLGSVSVNTDLSLTAERVRSRWLPMSKVTLAVKLRNGSLRIAPLRAEVAHGQLHAEAGMNDTGRGTMKLDMELEIDGMQPAGLPRSKTEDYIRNGKTDIRILAAGTGESVRTIMADLDGSLLIRMDEGLIENAGLEMAGADLITKTFSMLNPFSDEEDVTELQCAVVKFIIKDGIAVSDKGIAMETKRMTVVGGGVINLRTEEIDLGMRPHPREGLGLGAGQFAELVRLRGTLTRPETKPDTVAAVRTAATVGTAVMTSGLSLLAGGLFERLTADPYPCLTALGEKSKAITDSPQQSANGEEKQGVIDKVKGIFKGLFGN